MCLRVCEYMNILQIGLNRFKLVQELMFQHISHHHVFPILPGQRSSAAPDAGRYRVQFLTELVVYHGASTSIQHNNNHDTHE